MKPHQVIGLIILGPPMLAAMLFVLWFLKETILAFLIFIVALHTVNALWQARF